MDLHFSQAKKLQVELGWSFSNFDPRKKSYV